MKRTIDHAALFVFLTLCTVDANAQTVETSGGRALGMGGAFVAVANDSSATWWNPAGLAAGQFFDASVTWTRTEVTNGAQPRRDRQMSLAIATPPVGLSYYRMRLTTIRPIPTAQGTGGREDGLVSVPIRSFSSSQLGVTFVQSLFPGVHAGTTLKYVRGTLQGINGEDRLDTSRLLARGEGLEGGEAHGAFDLDVGVIAVGGPVRIGGVIRNVRRPEFGADVTTATRESVRVPRQFRVGVAYDGDAIGRAPFMIALDADARRYQTQSGDRRVVAVGAERWMLEKRFALRAGARFNTVGNQERAASGGMSIFIRSGLYLDGHVVGGGTADERGWGFAARVSF